MTYGQPAAAGRPAPQRASGCARCHHPRALHSNGKTPCRAFACTSGPDETPCEGYVTADEKTLVAAGAARQA